MGFLRHILFIFSCWSVGSSLFAATATFFYSESLCRLEDPELAKIQTFFVQETNPSLDIQSSGKISTPALLVEQVNFHLNIQYSILLNQFPHQKKKQYLFTYSGTSPPN